MIPGIPGESLLIEVTLPERDTDKIINVSIRNEADSELHSAELVHISNGRYRDSSYTLPGAVGSVTTAYFTIEDSEGVPSVVYGDWSESVMAAEMIEYDPELLYNLKQTGYLIVGQGLGITQYTNTLAGTQGDPLIGVTVKAFSYIDEEADFDSTLALDITDVTGLFELWLDPGSYILRVEKSGVSLLNQIITVI